MIPRVFAAVVAAAIVLLLLAVAASAHASLVESDPPDGGTLEETPATLTATFDEDLGTDRSRIVVRDAATAEEVARGGISTDDPRVLIVELPELPPGDYLARWTAVTPDDGGVTRGEIAFTAAPPATPIPPPTVAPTPTGTQPSASPAVTTPLPTASPGASLTPSPSPSPTPAEQPGTTDLLVALLVAALAVGGIAVYLFRRGAG